MYINSHKLNITVVSVTDNLLTVGEGGGGLRFKAQG